MGGEIRDKYVNDLRTICEVHKEIYERVYSGQPAETIIPLLDEAFLMGKKLVARLEHYKFGESDKLWVKNDNSGRR